MSRSRDSGMIASEMDEKALLDLARKGDLESLTGWF